MGSGELRGERRDRIGGITGGLGQVEEGLKAGFLQGGARQAQHLGHARRRRPPRPMRCRNEVKLGGGPTRTMSSMLPMSMPSSRV